MRGGSRSNAGKHPKFEEAMRLVSARVPPTFKKFVDSLPSNRSYGIRGLIYQYMWREEGREQYTYEQYLARWGSLFGEEQKGVIEESFNVTKLSRKEFDRHLRALEVQDSRFWNAFQANDLDAADKALAAALPHEVALLV